MKTVLISGGSRGIGEACVRAFVNEGYQTAFLYKSNDEKANLLANETGAIAIKCDVAVPSEVKAAVQKVKDELGGIDVLINNAGVSFIGLIQDTDDETYRQVLDTNLSGAFYLCRECAPLMVSHGCGKIINIGSVWGKYGASCEVAYSASKAGLRGLTQALAKELGPSGITVNCIEPGVIDTPMNACFDADTKRALAEETPVGRLGTPEDVAALATFLASDAASFITGQCVGVDGGFAI
jgi:3-oxoacyl-[acyl-carrier protein] reductase